MDAQCSMLSQHCTEVDLEFYPRASFLFRVPPATSVIGAGENFKRGKA